MKTTVVTIMAFLLLGCSQQEEHKTQKAPEAAAQKVQQKSAPSVAPKQKEEASIVTKEPLKVTKHDPAQLFMACASCHGKDAQKEALGKSKVIKGWPEQKIVDALHGYKNGTYGGAMKGVMKGQVTKLSDADIEALAAYISKL